MKLSVKEALVLACAMGIVTRVGSVVFAPTCDLIHISQEEIDFQEQVKQELARQLAQTEVELAETMDDLRTKQLELKAANALIESHEKRLEAVENELALSKRVKNNSSNDREGYRSVNVVVTFYTSLASENGGFAGKTANNGNLVVGSLSAPKDIPFGTTFIIDGLPEDTKTNTFVVDDRGGAIKWINSNTMKLDVYVPRKQGEKDKAYYSRVNNLGVYRVTAKYKLP